MLRQRTHARFIMYSYYHSAGRQAEGGVGEYIHKNEAQVLKSLEPALFTVRLFIISS